MTVVTWSVVVTVGAVFGGVVWLMLHADREYARQDSEAPTQILPTIAWTHEAPTHPLNAIGAHQIMQQHRRCDRQDCPRKAVAYRVLVEAKRIRPDSGRNY
jgi:hypothetical protein